MPRGLSTNNVNFGLQRVYLNRRANVISSEIVETWYMVENIKNVNVEYGRKYQRVVQCIVFDRFFASLSKFVTLIIDSDDNYTAA